ncbi:TPA: hypothetical protein QCY71_005047 [Bacillus cereus]|nr:hypothetical protein [Bacillus cereus]
MSNDTMTFLGFWITILGTVVGLVSLWITVIISKNTSKIRDDFMKKHLQEKYKIFKGTIVLKLDTSYALLKESDILDEIEIKESIISLNTYDDILSKETKKKLKTLKKMINNTKTRDSETGKSEIRNLLYEIITRLKNELDEHTELIKETIK